MAWFIEKCTRLCRPGLSIRCPVSGGRSSSHCVGLVDARSMISLSDLREFAAVDIDKDDPRYRKPLEKSVRALAKDLPVDCDIVLLGSIATGKYIDIFLRHFGERLRFPADFVGRG